MAEEQAQAEQQQEKTVPLSSLIAIKKSSQERERQLKAELAAEASRRKELEAELELLRVSNKEEEGEEEDIEGVKKLLLEKHKQITAKERELEEKLSSFAEREKKIMAKELALRYGVDEEQLLESEDPEKTALALYAERLQQEKEELEKKSKTYESGIPMSSAKSPLQMSDEEFQAHLARLRAEARSKR
jgi:hypothetical protein